MGLGHYATYAVAAALALCSISACGDDEPDPTVAGSGAGTTSSGGQGGEAATHAGAGGSSQDAGTDSGSDAGPALEGCVVAQRIDECCPLWAAVTRAEAFADPCLVAIGEPPLRSSEVKACSPQVCPAIVCADLPPDSRVAEPVGVNGACVVVDECHA